MKKLTLKDPDGRKESSFSCRNNSVSSLSSGTSRTSRNDVTCPHGKIKTTKSSTSVPKVTMSQNKIKSINKTEKPSKKAEPGNKIMPGLAQTKRFHSSRKSVDNMTPRVESTAVSGSKIKHSLGRKSEEKAVPKISENPHKLMKSESQPSVGKMGKSYLGHRRKASIDLLDNPKPSPTCNTSSQPDAKSQNGNLNNEPKDRKVSSLFKKGFVPKMLRRAIGSLGGSVDKDIMKNKANGRNLDFADCHSISSSCLSDLELIKPPSLMEEVEMDNSVASIASLNTEVADMVRSFSDTKISSHTQAFNIEKTARKITDMFGGGEQDSNIDDSTGTYVIDSGDDVEDLPRDEEFINSPKRSRIPHRTPSPQHSLGSSRESTPKAKKRLTPKQRRSEDKGRFRTYTLKSDNGESSANEDKHSRKIEDWLKSNPLSPQHSTLPNPKVQKAEPEDVLGRYRRLKSKVWTGREFKTNTLVETTSPGFNKNSRHEPMRHSFAGIV